MTGREQLNILGYPTFGTGAQAAKVAAGLHAFQSVSPSKDFCNTDYLKESSMRSMSGNGMSLCCAGFVLLCSVLFIEDVEQ